MNHAVITGATSMIGAALAEQCVKRGTAVTAVVRPECRKIERLPHGGNLLRLIECPIYRYKELPQLIGRQEGSVFYHMAWAATGEQRNERIAEQCDNIQYTLQALHAAKEIGCSRFIGAGSQAEYGVRTAEMRKTRPDSMVQPDTPYGIAKYAAGRLAKKAADSLGIEYIWTRIYSVYGPYDKETSMISCALKNILEGKRTAFTEGRQLWDYLYSEDAGRALYLLGTYGRDGGVYNIASGESRPLRDFIEALFQVCGKKEGAQGLGEKHAASDINLCADIEALKRDTGFTPEVGFAEGIRKTMEWMQNWTCK